MHNPPVHLFCGSIAPMTQGFWNNLPRPFFVLAPLADVTDAAFRRLIAKYSRHSEQAGGPDVFYTEFVSCD